MDTMRKYCKDELFKGCSDCQKEDVFGDTCHAYQAYHQACEDTLEKVRDMMTFHQQGLGGYFTISQDEWYQLEEKIK